MGNRTKRNRGGDSHERYVKTMMRLHRISRREAEKWYQRMIAGYNASGIVQAMRAVARMNAPQDDTDPTEQVIPFTGTHPNEDDPPDAA